MLVAVCIENRESDTDGFPTFTRMMNIAKKRNIGIAKRVSLGLML